VSANDAAVVILTEAREFILECSEILLRDNILKPDQMADIVRSNYIELWKKYDLTPHL